MPHFSPKKYHTWVFDITSHLSDKGVWGVIDGVTGDWVNLAPAARNKRRACLFEMLRRLLGDEYQYLLLPYTPLRVLDVWNALKNCFRKNDAANRLALEKSWTAYAWLETWGVEKFLGGINILVSEFATAGIVKTDEEIFTKMLQCLHPDYSTEESIMQSWTVQDMDLARTLLMKRQQAIGRNKERAGHVPSMQGVSFMMQGDKSKQKEKEKKRKCEKETKAVPKGKKDRKKSKENPEIVCFYCLQKGHPKFRCSTKQEDKKKGVFCDNVRAGPNGAQQGNAYVTQVPPTTFPQYNQNFPQIMGPSPMAIMHGQATTMQGQAMPPEPQIAFQFATIRNTPRIPTQNPPSVGEFTPDQSGTWDPQYGFSFCHFGAGGVGH
jgi:gag-polypeptide of LTR copia-type